MILFRLVRMEIVKLARRPRAYLGYAGMLFLTLPFILWFHYGDPQRFLRHQVGDFEIVGNFFNALFLARMILEPSLGFFSPLFASMVAGDMLAGEASEGTLRALLVRPVGRVPVATAKFVVSVLHTVGLMMFLGAVSLGLGGLFFGFGDLLNYEQGIYVIPVREALLRLAGAYLAGVLGVMATASIAFLLSTLVDNSNGAIVGAMMVLIIVGIISKIPYFENVAPYLYTTHLDVWRKFLAETIPWDEVRTSAAWLAGYTAVCFGLALLLFRRKDILS